MAKKDNSAFRQKVLLRKEALKHVSGDPVIMETHGGRGEIFRACYSHIQDGIVLEKDLNKSAILGLQRPTWRVYETDCEAAIREGVGSDMKINFLDIDPYGDPWRTIDAFLESDRERVNSLCVVVNDGLRKSVRFGKSGDIGVFQDIVKKYGIKFYDFYLDICQEMMKEKVGKAGYSLVHFSGYYCGTMSDITHYMALLTLNQ